jgi:ribosomal protein L17
MLEFTESLHKQLRLLRKDTEGLILVGKVRDMEQYRHLLGRLEAYTFVEDALADLLKKYPID